MNGFAIFECDDSEVALKFSDPDPMPDAAILCLHFLSIRCLQGHCNPFFSDVRAFDENVIEKVVGGQHGSLTPAVLQPRHPVKHRLGPRHVVRPVRHKVPKALKLKLLVRLRSGQ